MVFKCKMCGGDLDINQEMRICECLYCGSRQTLPKLGSEKRNNMFDRAGHFRRNNEYDKAMSLYEQILNEETEDAEVYWSLVLCRFGIEYVEDPETHRRIPTVNRAQYNSILSDADYLSALKYADGQQRIIYEEEAKEIDRIQKGILDISNREEPFDVFICYKESDDRGRRTPDSVLANDLYHQLTQEGFKVFFARITLEDKLGSAYEPYIFAALNSARVMVALGTKPEYFNAVWVKNEWSRYLSLINGGANKVLIPAYKDMDPYDLPEAFSHLQAQDMSRLGFMQDLIRGIKKLTDKEQKPEKRQAYAPAAGGGAQALVERAYLFMEDGEFARADELCEQALNQDPKNAQAYVAKLMIERKNSRQEQLSEGTQELTENKYFQKALRFAEDGLKQELERCNQMIMDRNKDNVYADILESVKKNGVQGGIKETIAVLETAISRYEGLLGWRDSEAQIEQCKSRIETLRGQLYQEMADLIAQHPEEETDAEKLLQIMETAIDNYQALGEFEDSESLLRDCRQKREQYRAQIEKEKRNRLKRRAVVSGLAACAVIAVILVIKGIYSTIQHNRAYEAMTALAEKGEYSAAVAEMEAIGKKQEGIAYLYEKASEYEESGDDDKVLIIYNCLENYGESEAIYRLALIKMSDKDYEGALKQFKRIKTYKDSAAYIDVMNWAKIRGTLLVFADNEKIPGQVVIPGYIEAIMEGAFANCGNMTSVEIPDSVTRIGEEAFKGCRSLTSVEIPDSVTEISARTFTDCRSLISVEIPDSVTKIGGSAFSACSSLTSVEIPDSVTTIEAYVFYGCSSLTSVKIPDSVTEIGVRAFYGCSSLTSVEIPDGVTIDPSAFQGTPLEDVY